MLKLPCAWLWSFVILRIVHASHIVYGFDPSPKVPVHNVTLGKYCQIMFLRTFGRRRPQQYLFSKEFYKLENLFLKIPILYF
jgi:hypothetical protein